MGFGTGVIGLIAIVVIAYLIYKLIKSEKIILPSRIVPSKSAEDILNERYAKGELTREQCANERRPEELRELKSSCGTRYEKSCNMFLNPYGTSLDL